MAWQSGFRTPGPLESYAVDIGGTLRYIDTNGLCYLVKAKFHYAS